MFKTLCTLAIISISTAAFSQQAATTPAKGPNDVCKHFCGELCTTENQMIAKPMACNDRQKPCYEKYGECKEIKGKCQWVTKPELRVCLMKVR